MLWCDSAIWVRSLLGVVYNVCFVLLFGRGLVGLVVLLSLLYWVLIWRFWIGLLGAYFDGGLELVSRLFVLVWSFDVWVGSSGCLCGFVLEFVVSSIALTLIVWCVAIAVAGLLAVGLAIVVFVL